MPSCPQCKTPFEVTKEDLAFYDSVSPLFGGKKYGIPPPTQCPECRQQRRVAQANQIHLYKRKCDLSGQPIISNYHPSDPYKVYEQEIWFSDKWDALTYGRDFDFSRPFFPQLQELCLAVPRPNLQTGFQYDENSQYTNYAGKNKNCYLIFDSDENWDTFYSYSINGSKNSMDCYRARVCELCYECIDCLQCYNCRYLQDSTNCTDSFFLKNCTGCKNCILCSNVMNKEYCIENKQVTKEQYEAAAAALTSSSALEQTGKYFAAFKEKFPQKFMHGVQNENATGDYLTHCKNAEHCFDSSNLWDCKYVFQAFNPLKTAMDIQECGDAERLYECTCLGYNAYDLRFCMFTLADTSEALYCMNCPHSKHCFGCVGLQHKEYCVFNKQCSKEEYEALCGKIIDYMTKTKEWGEFYPISFSMFPYNETIAQEQFPLTKEEAVKRGYKWRDDDQREYKAQTTTLPETIAETPDTICDEVLACRECKHNYKIVDQEFALLKQLHVPVPQRCFQCRHEHRRLMRNPRQLFDRKCAECSAAIRTTYTEDRPEKILCEPCYQKSLS